MGTRIDFEHIKENCKGKIKYSHIDFDYTCLLCGKVKIKNKKEVN